MAFTSFTAKKGGTPEEFNKPIGGSRFLEVGEHDVTIVSVEAGETSTGKGFLLFTWENEHGSSHSERIYPVNAQGEFSAGYKRLFSLISEGEDKMLRSTVFGDYLPADVKRFGTLVGLSATINIIPAREGYDLMRTGDGKFFVIDVTKEEGSNAVSEEVFEDRKEAAAHARDLGMYRAFPSIIEIQGRNIEKNTAALVKVLSGSGPKVVKKASM